MEREDPERLSDRSEVARGARLAALSRSGALIEAASFPLFLWLYGPVVFGTYATLLALVRITAEVSQMGMDSALQRFIPALKEETDIHRAVANALAVAGSIGLSGAIIIVALAPQIEDLAYGLGGNNEIHIEHAIRLYAWTLPLWTMLGILTSCVRARRAYGPEIRIRFFYEQILRTLLATLFAVFGATTYGLFVAHLSAMAVAVAMAVMLLSRHFQLRLLIRAGFDGRLFKRMVNYALPMMPTTLIQRLFSELPVLVLNLVLPGAPGAEGAGYYTIARKLSSVTQVIYNSFDYVMAPLAAFRVGETGPASVTDIYSYSTRLMSGFGIVIGATVIAAGNTVGGLVGADASAVWVALPILVLSRVVSFLAGPAPIILRTLSASYWILINGLCAIICMVGLMLLLIDADAGLNQATMGAAIGAASGIVVTSFLAVIEVGWFHQMWPYSREVFRPVYVALVLAAATLIAGELMGEWPATLQLITLVVVLVLSLAALTRYGFSRDDTAAFGWAHRLR